MLKCLHCEAQYDSDEIILYYPLIAYVNPEDNPGGTSHFICSNGHLIGVSKRDNESFVLYEIVWYPKIPGSLTHLSIFNFKTRLWCTMNIASKKYAEDKFEEYLNQQNQLKSETSMSRLEWLKCAKRLNICKDIRLLVGTYVKPSEFWKIEESCVVQ